MIFAHLSRSWRARYSQYTPVSSMLGIVRSLRVLRYWREHQALCRLELVRRFVDKAPGGDLFHHLSRRSCLANDLSARQRVQCLLSHYRFEEAAFVHAYHQAVYGGGGGLTLWQHDTDEHSFLLRLEMAPRLDAEGGLTIALVADGKVLHRLSYTWVDGALAGVTLPTVPFITCNQGRWHDCGSAFAAFEEAFPNNSPGFFCFAALQGVAQTLGIDQVAGIKSAAHAACPRAGDAQILRHFENAYDGFWKVLGGVEIPGRSYLIRLPFYLKPLADMPSKHRKRAAQRRACWRAIGDATRSTLLRHLASAVASQACTVSAPEVAEA